MGGTLVEQLHDAPSRWMKRAILPVKTSLASAERACTRNAHEAAATRTKDRRAYEFLGSSGSTMLPRADRIENALRSRGGYHLVDGYFVWGYFSIGNGILHGHRPHRRRSAVGGSVG